MRRGLTYFPEQGFRFGAVPVLLLFRARSAVSTALVVACRLSIRPQCAAFSFANSRISRTVAARAERSVRENTPFHRWDTKKLRCLPGASSGVLYCEGSPCGGRFGLWLSVRGGGDVRHPHDADDVRGALRNPRAFR